MKKMGLFIVFIDIAVFVFFKFIVVKLAYAKYPEGQYFSGFVDAITFSYTKSPCPDGVYHELYGIVSYFKTYVYCLCLISGLLGLWLIFYKKIK